jgi:hypothetical protein
MGNCFVRVAQERDFEDIRKHLLVVGELAGDCFSCRHIGIDYAHEKYCPGCRTDFKYMTLRKPLGSASAAQMARLCQKRPDLIYVEYADIKEISDRQKAKSFLQ